MSVQMADSHLTYIGSTTRILRCTVYDVYQRDGGHQLGWVLRDSGGKTWRATTEHPVYGPFKVAKTRWEAATAIWGNAHQQEPTP
ncbi:MAG TPA: hypothetical protein VFT50_11555 [Baekduia sp.]|nr:hypothetical protein [Baekduia sp.]